MTRRTSRELIIAASVFAGAFLGLTLYVRFRGPMPGDARGLRYAQGHSIHSQNVSDLYQLFGTIGTPAVGLATVLVAAIVVFTNVGARPAGLVLASAAIALAEHPVAHAIGTTHAATELAFPAPYGFPSGHLLYVTSVFGMFAVLGRRYGRPEVTFIAVVLILAMALQRVVTGSHLVSEVLGGALLGAAWLCFVLAADAEL